jgi:hypothetical protein
MAARRDLARDPAMGHDCEYAPLMRTNVEPFGLSRKPERFLLLGVFAG